MGTLFQRYSFLLLYIAMCGVYFITLSLEMGHERVFAKFVPIVLLVIWVGKFTQYRFNKLLSVGLAFSAGGDILLELNIVDGYNEMRFLGGMGAFFIAHLCYVIYFSVLSKAIKPLYLAIAAMLGIGQWLYVSPHLNQLLIPVSLYMVIICIMLWRALAAANWQDGVFSRDTAMAWGAVLFALSDSLLALSLFKFEYSGSHYWVMLTYYVAQYAIAYSVTRD